MRTASAVARYLAGVIFLVMGLNGFLNFIPLPPPGGIGEYDSTNQKATPVGSSTSS